MRNQTGVSLSGFLLWAVVLVLAALLGFKAGPAYLEYMTIQRQFKIIAGDPAMKSRQDIEKSFYNRAVVENIRSVAPADLEVARNGDKFVISAAYSVKVPLFSSFSLCMDFFPTSGR